MHQLHVVRESDYKRKVEISEERVLQKVLSEQLIHHLDEEPAYEQLVFDRDVLEDVEPIPRSLLLLELEVGLDRGAEFLHECRVDHLAVEQLFDDLILLVLLDLAVEPGLLSVGHHRGEEADRVRVDPNPEHDDHADEHLLDWVSGAHLGWRGRCLRTRPW